VPRSFGCSRVPPRLRSLVVTQARVRRDPLAATAGGKRADMSGTRGGDAAFDLPPALLALRVAEADLQHGFAVTVGSAVDAAFDALARGWGVPPRLILLDLGVEWSAALGHSRGAMATFGDPPTIPTSRCRGERSSENTQRLQAPRQAWKQHGSALAVTPAPFLGETSIPARAHSCEPARSAPHFSARETLNGRWAFRQGSAHAGAAGISASASPDPRRGFVN